MADTVAAGDELLLTVELTLTPSTAPAAAEERDALRGIKARRRKGNPMVCACCTTTLGAAPFILVLGRGVGTDREIQPATAGVCRRCGPDLQAAGERAVQIVRGIWPALAGYDLAEVG